eukprot:m.94269 g.94269  ORF g.94269 m.94269 type:complete len:185 (-) comp13021_c5_seq1:895-1449(-)
MARLNDKEAAAFEAQSRVDALQAHKPVRVVDDVFSMDSRFTFSLQFAGSIQGLLRTGGKLIEYIDQHRASGNIAYKTTHQDIIKVTLTRFGIKATDVLEQEVFHRIPLHTILDVMYILEDGRNSTIVVSAALKNPRGTQNNMIYYLYQADTEETAVRFCQLFGRAFELLKQQTQHTATSTEVDT